MVDGGVTPHNNPALMLLMLATLKAYRLNWKLGPRDLLLISVGTGLAPKLVPVSKLIRAFAFTDAARSLIQLLGDCNDLNETILQWMSQSLSGRMIDRELGDLSTELMGDSKLLSYARYNVHFDRRWLEHLGVATSDAVLNRLSDMDNAGNVNALREIGDAAASQLVRSEHLPEAFD